MTPNIEIYFILINILLNSIFLFAFKILYLKCSYLQITLILPLFNLFNPLEICENTPITMQSFCANFLLRNFLIRSPRSKPAIEAMQ